MSNDPLEEPVWVKSQEGSYPIYIGYQGLAEASHFHPLLSQKKVFILSHPSIAAHYLCLLTKTCLDAGARQVDHLLIPQGDDHKTLETASQVWTILLEMHLHRDTIIIGLGGGVITDLAGFCAACFLRGVKVIQCPTSLLGQIDAAIGGKTGVNHPLGKNLIGAFHQPGAVIVDLSTLKTLPYREFIAGLGELIKYAVTLDAGLFVWLQKNLPQIMEQDQEVLPKAVRWACELKAKIVSLDEKEKGQRIFLNFGHTVAHALESLLNYKEYLHGEAVAIGMMVALYLSLGRGWITIALLEEILALLKKAQLPTVLPKKVTVAAILDKMQHDKKHSDQQLQWVLLKGLGEPLVCGDIAPEEIREALVKCGAKP